MVVIVILALLVALVGPKLMGRTDDAKITDARVQIKNIETALKLYKLDNGSYPSTEQGLSALVAKPTVGVIPKSYKDDGYLESKKIPKDPWGNDYLYISPVSMATTTSFPTALTAPREAKGRMSISPAGM